MCIRGRKNWDRNGMAREPFRSQFFEAGTLGTRMTTYHYEESYRQLNSRNSYMHVTTRLKSFRSSRDF